MRRPPPESLVWGVPLLAAALLVARLGSAWAARVPYPFDLEWMEGGMLAHAWRLQHGLPLYGPPSPEFVPFVYPPGYPAVVAALASPFGMLMSVGRLVSITATAAACAALVHAVRRAGGAWPVAACAVAVFLGTWPQAGTFYDLVRPDALGVALFGWSVALVLDGRRGTPVAAGLLLAAAFAVKQNLAAFGLPLLLALAARGPAPALAFAASSVGPALALVGWFQWRSGGRWWTWMVDVPLSHPVLWERAVVDSPREWGTALPVVLAAGALATLVPGLSRQRSVPTWAAAALPVWAGIVAAWAGTWKAPPPGSDLYPLPTGLAWFAIGVAPVALAGFAVGAALDRVRGRGGRQATWREGALFGTVAVALGLAAWMRAHSGGWVNVHAPLFWVLALAAGQLAAAAQPWLSARRLGAVPALAFAIQLGWAGLLLEPSRYLPTQADVDAGWAFVARARRVDGPVLSPFASWIPVYAGKEPSLHAMAVWDVDHPGGPFRDDLSSIERALRLRHWDLILGGEQRFYGDLTVHYDPVEEVVDPGGALLMPKVGWMARPWRVLEPRDRDW